ncbi:hypothetical protein V6N12_024195 [Hibiscus sabdariffa]|uniref:DUF659 domain-containing protein n=1 Tax=Hibiscus sabdariffa TaxID=183260 RepID=A0ABR2FZV6_9ROSI
MLKLIFDEALPARIAESPFLPHVLHVATENGNVTSHTVEYYFDIVDEIGEEYIFQVVIDNEVAVKADGQILMQNRSHLYWLACSAHCLDLILEEIGALNSYDLRLLDLLPIPLLWKTLLEANKY